MFASDNEASEARLIRYIPSGHRGDPSDIEALVVYLGCDYSDYVTGQTFFMSGGLLARG